MDFEYKAQEDNLKTSHYSNVNFSYEVERHLWLNDNEAQSH
jgi:hypothetical protein